MPDNDIELMHYAVSKCVQEAKRDRARIKSLEQTERRLSRRCEVLNNMIQHMLGCLAEDSEYAEMVGLAYQDLEELDATINKEFPYADAGSGDAG